MASCGNRLRAVKEKIGWCLKRHLACLQTPRVLFSYLVFFVFLYLTWTVLANDDSRVVIRRPLEPASPNTSPSFLAKPTAIVKSRYRTQLRIPRGNYTEPRSSFASLLARSSSLHPGQTLFQPPSVIAAGEALLKSVSAVERKRKPAPQTPPQFKENSPYKVLKNYLGPPASKAKIGQAGVANDSSSITFATHATANYLKYLVDLSRRWNGPLSVAVYAPGADFALAVEVIVYLRACFPTVRNSASFHMIYDFDLPPVEFPHHLNWVNVSADCSGNNYEKHFTSREGSVLPYPVNVARNVARACSRTKYVLVSDVELVPSINLNDKFNLFMQQEARKTSTPNNHKVYVLPVFEIAPGREVPKTKRDLVSMIKSRTAFYFHSLVCPHCQRFPGITQWISGEKPTDNIKIFTVTKREGIYQRWEPVYIGTKKDPFFDERLTWDGLQDKMSQALEMCLVGYKFVVLDSAFLVHRPGLRTISYTSDDPSVKWRRPFVAYNRNATRVVTEELRLKYPGAFKRGMCHSEPEQTDES